MQGEGLDPPEPGLPRCRRADTIVSSVPSYAAAATDVTELDIDIASLLGPDADPAAAGITLRRVGAAAPASAGALLDALIAERDQLPQSDPAIVGALLRGLHTLFLRGERQPLLAVAPEDLAALDDALPPACPNRSLLLHLLVLSRSEQALRIAMQRIRQQPPQDSIAAAQVLSPLMQSDDWPVAAVFPALLEAIEHPAIAAPALDVANYLTRKQRVAVHPAADQVAMLNTLLAAVTRRLEQFEADPRTLGDDIATVQARLSEAVSLAVSLCDAVGLIGQPQSIPRLTAAMQLKHRRVQTEAAGALARMGDEAGTEHLLALVSEPSARLRVIAYADELGLSERIDDSHRSPAATAEAELALWLSQPGQMGVPPTSVETIDQRQLYWPSYERPIDCFLVRFHYDMGTRTYSNVGITGPTVFALANDVADLPMDDIYAIYAGWHAEHEDIFAIAAERLNRTQQRIVADLASHVERSGYRSPQVELFGLFLGEQAAVFTATRDDKPCRVISDGLETMHIPIASRSRPLDAGDLWNLYKGRKLLRTFNTSAVDDSSSD